MHVAPIVFATFLSIATLFVIYPPADAQPRVRHHGAERVLDDVTLPGPHRVGSLAPR